MSKAQGEPLDLEALATKMSDISSRMELYELAAEGKCCPMCWQELKSEEVYDPDAVYHEVVSWVTGPKLQSPVLRSRTGRLAHTTCIEKLLNGQSPDQEAIPGLEL